MIDQFFEYLGMPTDYILRSAYETIYMLFVSLFLGSIIGLFLAITLVLTNRDGILRNKYVFFVVSTFINMVRSVPFIILMVFIMPFTKLLIGTRIGTNAALVPLTIFIAPYLARLFENSFLEVNKGIIEAAKSMGANTFQIVWYFLLPEAKASLILSVTTGSIGLLGATAMAGAIGGGGVGDLALSYGYERMNFPLMLFTVIGLIIFVQIIQAIGDYLAFRARNKR